ncbi:DnaJ domain-containing protein [Candidatus Methylocalor cossyra]|uniref:Heat shock protein DnaJ domain protein n=1 Tax=Candidatus Methylocalor cossyra TaxID=3108543 RepID=A0ABM9NJC0_9GAMM
MIQLVLLLGIFLLAVLAVRSLLGPTGLDQRLRRGLPWLAALALLLLLSGRLGVLLPVLGALSVLLLRLLPALLPVALQWLPVWLRQSHSDPGNGRSTAESTFLRMHLDHASGAVSGEILRGRHAGRSLEELTPDQLQDLLAEYARVDPDSATLLRAYLERVYGDNFEARRGSNPTGGERMSADEAYAILGLERHASREDIIAAHRRLMQKLHPDRGGSDYLAAKINQAKDVLLGS